METRRSIGGGLDKKCFVKVVAIGDSGVGKTSLI
jgi:GTPase SAR1 family protein